MLPVFLLVASLLSVEGWSQGSCLGYDVLCTTADYQLRRYKKSVWVGINASEYLVTLMNTADLNRYFRWANTEEMKTRLTGQTLVSYTGIRVLAVYQMLPEELWDNPPTPTDPRLFITRFPMMDVFARIIRGFALIELGDFNRTLTAQKVPANNSKFFIYFCLGKGVVFNRLQTGQDVFVEEKSRSIRLIRWFELVRKRSDSVPNCKRAEKCGHVDPCGEMWFVATGGFDCPAP